MCYKRKATMPQNNTLLETNSAALVAESLFFGVLSIVILAGNTLVCTAIYKNRKLRTKTNYYLVSLAVADIMVGVFSVPYWIYFRLVNPGVNTVAYKVYITYDILCGTASIINLVMISLERCISVTEPAIHRNLSRTTISLTIAAAWTYALIVACVNQVSGSYLKWYPPFVSTASFFLPLFIILIAYSLIYKIAQTRERARRSRSLAREIRIAVTLAVVIAAFVVAWLPFFVMLLVTTYCRTCEVNYSIVVPFTKWMHYSGSMVNPVIYTHRNRDFRHAFAKILISCGDCGGKELNSLSQPNSRASPVGIENCPSVVKQSYCTVVDDNNENPVRITRANSYALAHETNGQVTVEGSVCNETRA
ncbi:D(1)-like dopamine receptor isoform X3 [Oculina patagonica]